MTVRANFLFGNSSGASVIKELFTVPSDRTAIVRTLTIQNAATAARDCTLYIQGDDGSYRPVWVELAIPAGQSRHLSTWMVAEAGRKIACLSTGNCFVTGHGSLLEGVNS